ncbi:MAG TPA: TorF family putative porin [Steroidobacteraceae bacterium]|nr:TorF family putative porin [Steroidobacteraceae bacterium]
MCALALLRPQPGRCQSDSGLVGGNLVATSDYIYRGVSQSDGHGALQGDLHASSSGGTFGGVWASTRDSDLEPGTPAEVQLYLGQRFGLGSAWSATVSGRADYFVGGSAHHSDDYQEISAALTWLDRYTLSLTAIPNAVRYSTVVHQYEGYAYQYYQVYRSAAFVADAAGQWLLREELLGAGLYLTAAAGYYYSSRPDDHPPPAVGYLYGNAGLALVWRRWRVDLGFFAAQSRAGQLFPYPVANRVAGTLSWEF